MTGSISTSDARWTSEEMMTIALSRMLPNGSVCFVGIGLPSVAGILAQRTHAPDLFLVYESGTLGPRPTCLPLSVADNVLASTAVALVSVPELFNYWLQPGRIDFGVLGAGQVDRFANINSTVIGSYDKPKVRLPGAGGAPEIAGASRQTLIVVRQSLRTFVDPLDFVTTVGNGSGPETRPSLGFLGAGPKAVVTDVGVYEPESPGGELRLTRLLPGATIEDARAATGWDLHVAPHVELVAEPTVIELEALRTLNASRGGTAR